MSTTKKKITAIVLVVAIVVAVAVGATMAYFTDTDQADNTFTVGNVDIRLDEAPIKVYDYTDNHYYADPTSTPTDPDTRVKAINFKDYAAVTPGAIIDKDPTVSNDGTENAYVKTDVQVSKDALEAFGITGAPYDLFKEIVTGGIMDLTYTAREAQDDLPAGLVDSTGTFLLTYKELTGEIMEFTVYRLTPLTAKTSDVPVFTTITVPSKLDNKNFEDILEDGFEIHVTASAIQAKGFATPGAAYKALAEQKNS